MPTVGLLHPGEMGASIGAALRRAGLQVLWASAGRQPATRRRAQAADLTDVGTLAALAARSHVVVSVCPPHAAVEVAASGFDLQGAGVRSPARRGAGSGACARRRRSTPTDEEGLRCRR